jgi:D-inositol-3-phosphate glycosyltransferase
VVDGKTGLHVPPQDPAAIAAAVAEVLADPAWARELGDNGYRRVRARYSWSRIAADTEKAYQLALGAAVPAAPATARRSAARRLESTGGRAL